MIFCAWVQSRLLLVLQGGKKKKKTFRYVWGKAVFQFWGGLVLLFLIMEAYARARMCHCRTTLWWATGSPERHSPAPIPDRMMRVFPCVQPASLGLLSSLHVTLMGASSSGGLVCCMGSHLKDSRCFWAGPEAAERTQKPFSIHSSL